MSEKLSNHSSHCTAQDIDHFVLELWRDILKIEFITLDDNIFDLGVSSIGINIFIGRIEQNLNITISLGTIYKLQTPRDYSEHIVEQLNQ